MDRARDRRRSLQVAWFDVKRAFLCIRRKAFVSNGTALLRRNVEGKRHFVEPGQSRFFVLLCELFLTSVLSFFSRHVERCVARHPLSFSPRLAVLPFPASRWRKRSGGKFKRGAAWRRTAALFPADGGGARGVANADSKRAANAFWPRSLFVHFFPLRRRPLSIPPLLASSPVTRRVSVARAGAS